MNQYGLSEEDFYKISAIEEDFQVIENIMDHRFGNISLMQCIQDPTIVIMRKEKFSNDPEECERDIFQAKERTKLKHDNILQMPDFSTQIIERADGTKEMMVSGYYEYPDWDLEREIQRRSEEQQYFPPENILSIIEDMLQCLTYLQENKMIHGDIRPKYISLQTTQQPNKLNDRLGDPYSPNKVQINHLKNRDSLYMAPILFKSLALKKKKIKHNPYKSEIFSLGLIILEAGLLKSIQSIYDLKEKKIDVDNFLELIDQFMNIYGEVDLLRESLVWFLDLNGKTRQDPRSLLKMFQNLKHELYGSFIEEDQEKNNEKQDDEFYNEEVQDNQKQMNEKDVDNHFYSGLQNSSQHYPYEQQPDIEEQHDEVFSQEEQQNNDEYQQATQKMQQQSNKDIKSQFNPQFQYIDDIEQIEEEQTLEQEQDLQNTNQKRTVEDIRRDYETKYRQEQEEQHIDFSNQQKQEDTEKIKEETVIEKQNKIQVTDQTIQQKDLQQPIIKQEHSPQKFNNYVSELQIEKVVNLPLKNESHTIQNEHPFQQQIDTNYNHISQQTPNITYETRTVNGSNVRVIRREPQRYNINSPVISETQKVIQNNQTESLQKQVIQPNPLSQKQIQKTYSQEELRELYEKQKQEKIKESNNYVTDQQNIVEKLQRSSLERQNQQQYHIPYIKELNASDLEDIQVTKLSQNVKKYSLKEIGSSKSIPRYTDDSNNEPNIYQKPVIQNQYQYEQKQYSIQQRDQPEQNVRVIRSINQDSRQSFEPQNSEVRRDSHRKSITYKREYYVSPEKYKQIKESLKHNQNQLPNMNSPKQFNLFNTETKVQIQNQSSQDNGYTVAQRNDGSRPRVYRLEDYQSSFTNTQSH